MLDVLNEQLIAGRRGPGRLRPRLPRGHLRHVRPDDQRRRRTARSSTTTCQLHMRLVQGRRRRSTSSRGGPTPFPVIKDLVVDRARVRPDHPGRRLHLASPPAPRPTPTRRRCRRTTPTRAFDAATCIGCGACVAACPNGSAMLFTARQDHPPRPAAAGPARARRPGGRHGRASTTPRASAAAPTSASAPRPAPRASRWTRSPGSTTTCSARSGPGPAPRAEPRDEGPVPAPGTGSFVVPRLPAGQMQE